MKKEVDFNLLYDEEKKNLVGLLIENNFDEIYEPITTESLRFFLPLNGACLIDYQLHFFKQNNIKKIYIVVTHHEKELQHYIEKFQKSKKRYNDLDIEIIKLSKKVKTLGDALRDFKKCVEIYQDILLLLSDTIPIANIKEIIKAHFVNKEKCKNQIMTLILSHCSDENKSHNDDFVIAYDNFSFKLLLFEPLKNKNYLILTSEIFDEVKPKDGKKGTSGAGATGMNAGGKKEQKSSLSKVGENKEYHAPTINFSTSTNSIIISYDLVMPNIFIITPQVFKLFEENFDYQCMRKDFIYNILKQEIKIEEIYVHALNNDYNYTECNQIITTLTDFRIYFKFFKTLIERNVHPFLANSSHLLPDLPKFIFCEPRLYKAKNAIIDDSCKLLKIVLVENYTEISEKTLIENSVICKNCKIGKNVKIVNSIIGKNSILKDNVTIISSFISENNIINESVYIDECCVVGKNMNIPAGTKIGKYTRLSAFKHLKGQLKVRRRSKEQDDHSAEEREKKDFAPDGNGGEAPTLQFEQEAVTKENEENTLNESTHKDCEEDAGGEKQEKEGKKGVKEEKGEVKEEKEEVNEEKGEVNEVAEGVNEVAEEVNEFAEEVNEVAEEVNEVAEEVNEVSEEVKEVDEDVKEEKEEVNEEKEEKEQVKEVDEEVKEEKEEKKEMDEEEKEMDADVKEEKEEVNEEKGEVNEVAEEVNEEKDEKEEVKEVAEEANAEKEESNEVAEEANAEKEEANEVVEEANAEKEEANEVSEEANAEKEEANEVAEANEIATDAKEVVDENEDVAAEEPREHDMLHGEPFELNNFIVKTRYSEDQLRLFSLIGDAQNYGKIKMTSFSEYDSEEESDEDSVYSTSKNYSTMSDTNVSDKDDESNCNSTANMSDINKHFDKINFENEKNSFVKEISLLCKEAIEKPQHMSHKILEMKSFRLSLNYTDLDVIISFFPIVWDFINSMEFDKDTWVENFDKAKLDLLFSSFLLDDHLYYETIYGLILDFSKKEFLTNDVQNNVYGSDKLCAAFEYIYHSDIFEFNYFNEWISKNEEDEYLANNKRLKAFAEWLADE